MMANKMFEMDDYMEILFCIYLHMNIVSNENNGALTFRAVLINSARKTIPVTA